MKGCWLSSVKFFQGGGQNLLLCKFLLLFYCFQTKFQGGAKVFRGGTASGGNPLPPPPNGRKPWWIEVPAWVHLKQTNFDSIFFVQISMTTQTSIKFTEIHFTVLLLVLLLSASDQAICTVQAWKLELTYPLNQETWSFKSNGNFKTQIGNK